MEKLKQFNEEKGRLNQTEDKECDNDDEALFSKYYHEYKGVNKPDSTAIPRFYSKPPKEGDVLQQKLREEARAAFLQRRSSELMDNDELQKLWSILEEKNTPPTAGDDQMIGYLDFMSIRNEVSDKCKHFFTAEMFTKFLKDDPLGRISISQLFSYIMRKVWLQQTRIGLSLFDIQGLGFLRESVIFKHITTTVDGYDCDCRILRITYWS
jgi:hypothetical protein